MWELTAENALDYLHQQGWLDSQPARIDLLTGGVSNLVLRVEQGDRRLVLKQSRPQLRTRAAWFSDVERIFRELEVQQTLHALLPTGSVPAVLQVDRDHFVFLMEHAPGTGVPWKTDLLADRIDLERGSQAGHLLGLIHERTANLATFTDRKVFVQLRVEPFYHRIQERHPDLASRIDSLIAGMMSTQKTLCHGDYSPKNLLPYSGGLTLVDHETAHLGDPAMDIGFFFSHLLLKSIRRPEQMPAYVALIRTAWESYVAQVTFEPAAEVLVRGFRHLGVCLLARIDGTSPVDYLPGVDLQDRIRKTGRELLLSPAVNWDEVLARLTREE